MKLISNGVPFDTLDDMEVSDFYDWLEVSRALDIDRELKARLAAIYGQQPDKKVHRARISEIENLERQKKIHLGINVFKTNKKLVERSWSRLQKNGRKRNKSNS